MWSSSGGVGGSTGVVLPEVVTPVTIEPLLGVQTIVKIGPQVPNTILKSSIWCGGNDLCSPSEDDSDGEAIEFFFHSVCQDCNLYCDQ